MKVFRYIGLVLGALPVMAGCAREPMPSLQQEEEYSPVEIVFASGNGTRAGDTTTENLKTIYVSCFGGSSRGYWMWANARFDYDEDLGVFRGVGDDVKYWPSSNYNYRFAACSRPVTIDSDHMSGSWYYADPLIYFNGDYDDVVYAGLNNPVYLGSNTLYFEHCLSKVESVNVIALNGYTISNVTLSLYAQFGSGSDYIDIASMGSYSGGRFVFSSTIPGYAWSGGSGTYSWREIVSNSSSASNSVGDLYFSERADGGNSNGLQVRCTWTASKGTYSETFTNTKRVQFYRGQATTLNISLGGNAKAIVFTSSNDMSWSSQDYTEPVVKNTD